MVLERGVKLFLDLVRRANNGEATGISYVGFVEHVHEQRFSELRGRPWAPSDVGEALRLANRVTAAAGRQRVRHGDIVIEAGMGHLHLAGGNRRTTDQRLRGMVGCPIRERIG